jgi:DNA-binding IclR family transcriptional regulator
VLEIVASAGDGVTAKAVARRSGFKLSTTYHLLNTLVHEGYLVRLSNSHGYGLGYKVSGLNTQLCSELDAGPDVHQALHALHTRAGAPVYYTVFRDSEVVIAAVADSPEIPRAEPLDLGFHEAPHATAFGKVMLAAKEDRDRRDYLDGGGLAKLTDRTITKWSDLEAELTHVRDAGMALEIEEFQPELACLGAPVIGRGGEITGAIALSVPAPEFSGRRWALERAARYGAARVSRLLATSDSAVE